MRYRGSIYVDIHVEDNVVGEVRQQEIAKQILQEVKDGIKHNEVTYEFTGGVALLISGDLLGNSERLDKI